MKLFSKFIWTFLAGLVLLWMGGGHADAQETTVPPFEDIVVTTEETAPPVTSEPEWVACPPVDGVQQYPQSYSADHECGPIDPCVSDGDASTQDYTKWHLGPCTTETTVVVGIGEPVSITRPELPSTGSESYLAWIAAIFLVGGVITLSAARRNRTIK